MNLCCVKCNSVLDKARISDVEVDVCPACHGLWLDRGEIERLGRMPGEHLNELRAVLSRGPTNAGISEVQRACPACPESLAEVKLGRVVVDFCKSCGGVFLDRGELDAALAAVKGSTLAQVLTVAGPSLRA